MRGTVIIFMKAPVAGRVKTRLGADIGFGRAAALFRILTQRTIMQSVKGGWRTLLSVDPPSAAHASARFWPAHLPRVPQGRGDLGRRMTYAFENAPKGPIIIIGADAPGLRTRHLRQAFAALQGADAVFGPAADGGYWLIGLNRRRAAPDLFNRVRWSTKHALEDTLRTLPTHFDVRMLETLADVDEAGDLPMIGAAASAQLPRRIDGSHAASQSFAETGGFNMKWVGVVLAVIIATGLFLFYGVLPQRFDAKTNVVLAHEPYAVSDEARLLHGTIPVADLHADTLLWKRNPAKRQSRGQTDLVRLREGGVALQVFTAVTKVPPDMNLDENAADKDSLTLLMAAQGWPPRTWFSIYERAAYQADRLLKLESATPNEFVFVRSASDLQRALDQGKLGGVYGIEGAHPLEGNLDNIALLRDRGLRVMGLQHFFDNELGGSLHGQSGAGLTAFGEAAVDEAVRQGMIIDVAHSSEAVVRDVLARTEKPVIVSHTGLKGHCDTARNIPDDLMKAIADHGGLVGVGYWEAAACSTTPQGIAAQIVYAIDLLGLDHVALGSDYDGAVTTGFDASELPALTQALLDAGLDEESIRAVMGGNAVRFFLEHLPAE